MPTATVPRLIEIEFAMNNPDILTIEPGLSHIDARQWDALAGRQPFMRHAFLSAMHDSGGATPDTGWSPHYLVLRRGATLLAAAPLYLKSHSRGEYVFDYAWADAYQRHGLRYYPKLLVAVPFTPVTGARLLAVDHASRVTLAQALIDVAQHMRVSSLHVLFPDESTMLALREAGYLLRESVQYHWTNAGYENLTAFLACLSRDKRKKLLQDSKKVQAAGISYRWLRGTQIDQATLAFFYECYCRTYFNHGNPPYLSLDFFRRLRRDLGDQLLLVMAERAGQAVAAALNLVDGETLYGRYWGTTEFISGLHFETCYMQSIAYCIAHRIARFEGGAQGEHKMARGLLPTPTWSAHWISEPRFAHAIEAFLTEESTAIHAYRDELKLHSPYK